ncbi:MAG: DUF445 family protein [Bacillota bacterium]|nr:DUF445 family protein [Bacillota bacterium]
MNDQQTVITVITAVTLVLSGTIAGYITNKYAVRWLFKPVKLFGRQIFDVSILSTDEKQEAFIDSLSDCVERRILTADVLKEEIINDTMKAHIDEIVDRFIMDSLPESFKSIKLSELKGFENTDASLYECLKEVLDENTSELLVHVLDAVNLSDYINDRQIQTASDNLYESLKHAFKNNFAIKDIISRLLTELLFSAMFNPDGRAALSILASKLFGGGGGNPLADLASMNLPDKISAAFRNLISSGVSGFIKDKTASGYVNEESRDRLAEKIEAEILKKYREKVDSLSNEDISPLITGISESGRLRETVSGMIYDYLDSNIVRLLGGKVKETVKIALGRLDPDQLCDVAERLMKGELKYLSYFGGVLGFLLSIPALMITLGGFAPSGFPHSPFNLIFLILLMGFIGIITNVIAIKMFFHPYKEIKTLSKFRHTKCFSRGLILQNQKVFAHTLGEYIGTELLTPDNIIKMLETHKASFIETLGENIMPALLSYFGGEAGKRKGAARISAYVFNKMSENRTDIADALSGGLGGRTFGSFINLNNPVVKKKGLQLYFRLLDKLAENPPDKDDEAYDYRFTAYALSNIIRGNSSLKEKVWYLAETFYMTEIADRKIGEFFSMDELSASAAGTLAKICSDNYAFDDFRNAVGSCIEKLVSDSEKYFSPEFASSISDKCAEAVYASAVDSVPELIKDVHISEITEEKVAALEPEEIKNVVMSFAAPAFISLYKLGSIGCVFGINTYLAFILFIADKLLDSKKQ